MKKGRLKKRKPAKGKSKKQEPLTLDTGLDRQKDIYDYAAIIFLVTIGLLYSLNFLQHFVFPNSDFTAFVGVGKSWLDFEIPRSMKRAPLFSIISAIIAKLFNAPVGSLLGTGLFNAAMLPLSMVLIYLVARRYFGRVAVWVAMLAGLSPWMIRMSSQPIAEITLVVLCIATALAAGAGTKWAYLLAMLASIARWDLAGLIPAVALVDILRRRKWLETIILGGLSSIPFILCMIITLFQLQEKSGGVHYLQVISEDSTFELMTDLKLYSAQIASFLNAPLLKVSTVSGSVQQHQLTSVIKIVSGIILGISFTAGVIFAVIKKQWALITALIAGIPYVIVHATYPYRMPRYCLPFGWAGLLLAAYPIFLGWRWFKSKPKPGFVLPIIHISGFILLVVWVFKMFTSVKMFNRFSPGIIQLAVIAVIVALAGFYVLKFIQRQKPTTGWLVIQAFLVLAIFSNIVGTARVMGDGKRGANFKTLAEWYVNNTSKDEKMLTTMPGYIALYANMTRENFVHIAGIKPDVAEDFESLIEECRKRDVSLIAWDSRLAGQVDDRYYKKWGIGRLKYLSAPFRGYDKKRIGPCKLIHKIEKGHPKIAVYRIMPEDVN